jgi:uncharacterized membrane protein YoaK (UPF0700 family)
VSAGQLRNPLHWTSPKRPGLWQAAKASRSLIDIRGPDNDDIGFSRYLHCSRSLRGLTRERIVMLVRQGDARGEAVDQRLAGVLAGIAGAINTAAFAAVGFFSANMTGNVSLLSDHIATTNFQASAFFLAVIASFIGGSAASTLLINFGNRQKCRAIYAYNILIEGLLLGILGAADPYLPLADRGSVLILGLAFLMGLQNAVVTQISGARVRTTHVSGLATDIGIGLGMLFDTARGKPSTETGHHYVSRLRLHGVTICSFLFGGVVGVLVYREAGGALFLLAAGVLAALATIGIFRARQLAEQGAGGLPV